MSASGLADRRRGSKPALLLRHRRRGIGNAVLVVVGGHLRFVQRDVMHAVKILAGVVSAHEPSR